MTTKMNLNGTTRKALVAAIAEITGDQPVYRRVPTCNYDIGDITVTKDGSIICPDDSDMTSLKISMRLLKDTNTILRQMSRISLIPSMSIH